MKYLPGFVVMPRLAALIILALAGMPCLAQPQAPGAGAGAGAGAEAAPVLRKPFTLRLRLARDRYYEEKFTRSIPYVYDNSAYLFTGEAFGLKLGMADGKIVSVTYVRQPAGADVELDFRQFVAGDGLGMMMLTIQNNLKHTLYVDAEMTNPGDKNVYSTAIRPIKPGQRDVETWAQPIIELRLHNFSLRPQISY